MSIFQALVLGFVQGFSEWLPISSTAHIELVSAFLHLRISDVMLTAFTAVIQWGTFFAAVVYFRKDIANILTRTRAAVRRRLVLPSGEMAGEPPDADSGEADRRLLLPILIGTLPVSIFGLLLQHKIETVFRGLYVVGASLIVFALLLGVAEARHVARRKIGSVTVWDGLWVGIGQAFALIPGASRSGTTITAALAIGLERSTAARFSFLLSLPAVFLAGAYELLKHRHAVMSAHLGPQIVVATIMAFVVGYASIDWMMKFLKKHPTYLFIVYRIALGILVIALAAKGILR